MIVEEDERMLEQALILSVAHTLRTLYRVDGVSADRLFTALAAAR